ncbi:putative baseplate assembly protein [Pyxidicoccus parkwayensis]|uniref:Baseplate assembly protein n=1 Tax=Pyxidicoccus parkwayensis TaxID=2813578 RepID=A0ABX7PAZ6_9BACT|nr:putative baseplate assembly protein [Pyxidicoccus parkwaysis]QSQ27583.1 putative baseplate assembly protein [Pyxidicoccus parkwaysis]
MGERYVCKSERRRQLVAASTDFNGIDYLEVLDAEATGLGVERQKTLWVHFFKELPDTLNADNVLIEGGVRLKDVGVVWAYRLDRIPVGEDGGAWVGEQARPDAKEWLVVRTDSVGDFSTYTLVLRRSVAETVPPDGFDVLLSRVDFTFKVECPSEFDCAPAKAGPPPPGADPQIDYLTRDFSSFRRLMLDRLSQVSPQWQERNAADLGVALVEVMAYAADYLSYYQDAAATEAYLGTARKRTSVRRHAKLLDYPMHDGCNSRAWVCVEAMEGADGFELKGPTETTPGTLFLTTTNPGPRVLDASQLTVAVSEGAEVFESLHDARLHWKHSEMRFYTWGEDKCCLPEGSTTATLLNEDNVLKDLAVGQVLLFEEVRGATTGRPEDADPSRRHPVRLTGVTFTEDPLLGKQVVDISWDTEDALPFELCLWDVEVPVDVATLSASAPALLVQSTTGTPGMLSGVTGPGPLLLTGGGGEGPPPGNKAPVSVARGNVVLVDHGRTLSGEELADVPEEGRYRPRLKRGPLTQAGRTTGGRKSVDLKASAAAAMRWSMEDVLPAIWLAEKDGGRVWTPRRTLLNSGRFSRELVAEVEEDGRARLRFGDNVMGERPSAVDTLLATYRIGNGTAGNVGAESISRLYHATGGDWRNAVLRVRNPLPATGGVEPESLAQVRINAPQAFRVQQRAVTEADYSEVAQRHPEVQRAVGSLRWTGSWHTMFVTVDRKGGRPVDATFSGTLASFLERFRLAGYDIRIEGPVFVPLDIVMTVCVQPGFLASNVKAALLEVFSSRDLPDGRRGFFHPDNFTFGEPVYLSRIVAAAMAVPGVAWVDTEESKDKPNHFKRWGQVSRDEWKEGLITMDRLEIARLDNDPSQPENGKLDFQMQGGL